MKVDTFTERQIETLAKDIFNVIKERHVKDFVIANALATCLYQVLDIVSHSHREAYLQKLDVIYKALEARAPKE